MHYSFYTADAFTSRRFHGAQIAVFPDAQGLSGEQMQRIAAEFNVSETVFITPSKVSPAHRQMRVFSPTEEVNFAGHPIIAAAWVLSEVGDIAIGDEDALVVFEQNSGPVEVCIRGKNGKPEMVQFSVSAEPKIDRFVPSKEELAGILGLSAADLEPHNNFVPLLVACREPYLIVPLRSYKAVREAVFNYERWVQSNVPSMLAQEILLFSTHAADQAADFHGRLVGPKIGVREDPPIGSATPAFAGYLCAHEHIRQGTYAFAIERGRPDSRQSILNVEMDNQRGRKLDIRIGGPAVTVMEGKISV